MRLHKSIRKSRVMQLSSKLHDTRFRNSLHGQMANKLSRSALEIDHEQEISERDGAPKPNIANATTLSMKDAPRRLKHQYPEESHCCLSEKEITTQRPDGGHPAVK
jgi:hypothetical protein